MSAIAGLLAALTTGCSSDEGDADRPSVATSSGATTTGASTGAPTTQAPTYDFSAIDPIVADFVAENSLNGAGLIIVDREGGVVFHEQWGEFTPDRVSLIASSSKMITAGVLLRLDDDGLLDIDAPIATVLDSAAANPTITTAQLLSNSSGLVGLVPDPTFAPYICQYLPQGTLRACADTILSTVEDDADVVPPDTEFRYGGAQWQVAGAVAEAASGKSWAELIEEIYVAPCGLEALGYNNHFVQLGAAFEYPEGFDGDLSLLEPTENPNLEGGAYVTTGDYAKLLLMHLRGGLCDDTRVLSTEALAAMHGDRIGPTYDGDAGGSETGYGMGWWVDRESGRISDGGAYGSVPWLDLEDGYGAFLVIEANSDTGGRLADLLYEPVETAMTAGA